MNRPCDLATCPRCRPGRPCAESFRWEQDEDYFAREDRWLDPPPPRCEPWEPNTYVDPYGRTQWIDPMGGRRL